MKYRSVWIILSLVISLVLMAACGGDAPEPAEEAQEAAPQEEVAAEEVEESAEEPMEEASAEGECGSEGVFCIGLVTDVGEVDDKSFNQSAWEGVQQAGSALGAKVDFIETKDAKDYGANIALFAENGYNVIVTVGFALGEATGVAASEYPEVNFIGVDQFQAEPVDNVAGLLFNEDKAGFLAGALAAMLSESGSVAAVLGTDLVPPVVAFGDGYLNGAKYINPDIEALATYHPGGLDVAFTDPEWGATTARQAIDSGADIIFGAGGKTGNGALIETASAEGVYCIGVDTDQWETVPEAHSCLVSSAMKLITPGVVELITAAFEGNLPSGNYFGQVGLAPFHDFDSDISSEIKDTLAFIDAGLTDGSIMTDGSSVAPDDLMAGGEMAEEGAEDEAMAEDEGEAMAAPAAGELGSPENPINVLFVPSVDAGVIVSGGEVMAEALNEATGLTFNVDVPTSYAATIEAMCASPEDTIGFIPALGYVLANNRCDVEVGAAAVRFGLSWYAAQILVGRDSDIQSIEDLAGKKWAVPDLGSTSGYLYPSVMFQDAGVEASEIVEAGGHGQSVLAVYNDEVDFSSSFFSPPLTDPAWQFGDDPEPFDPAAVVLNEEGSCFADEVRVLDARCSVLETAPDVFEKTRILMLSQQIPNDTMSFSPEFPDELQSVIIDAVVAFAASDACAESICSDEFYNWSGLEPVEDEFYDPVRQLIDVLGYTEEDIFE